MEALKGEPIVDRGTPEASWRQSGFLAGIASISPEDLLGSCARVVVVSPHPDDEVLGCGGLLSVCALRRTPILIVSVTNGENCYPGNEAWPPARLSTARKSELEQALAALGIAAPAIVRVGIPDGQVAGCEGMLVEVLDDVLRETDAVFVPWARDGHPDHEATARAAASVSRRLGARLIEFPIWAWHWVSADGGAFNGSNMSRLDLSPEAHAAKREAMACFTSQIATGDSTIPDPVLPAHILGRFARNYEVFIHD